MWVAQGWRSSTVKCALPAGAGDLLARRLRQWSLAEGGRFQLLDPSTVVIWSAGCGVSTVPVRVAEFRLTSDATGSWVRWIAWDPERYSPKDVWRAIFWLAGISGVDRLRESS